MKRDYNNIILDENAILRRFCCYVLVNYFKDLTI